MTYHRGLGFDRLVEGAVQGFWVTEMSVSGLTGQAALVPPTVKRFLEAAGFTSVSSDWKAGGKVWVRYEWPRGSELAAAMETPAYRRDRVRVALANAARDLGSSVRFVMDGGEAIPAPVATPIPVPGDETPGDMTTQHWMIGGVSAGAVLGLVALGVGAYFLFRSPKPVRRNVVRRRRGTRRRTDPHPGPDCYERTLHKYPALKREYWALLEESTGYYQRIIQAKTKAQKQKLLSEYKAVKRRVAEIEIETGLKECVDKGGKLPLFQNPARRTSRTRVKKEKPPRRWRPIKATTEMRIAEAVATVRDAHPKTTHMPPGVLAKIKKRGPGVYVYGWGGKGDESLRKYKPTTDMTGILASARIAAKFSDEPHWVIDFHESYPVVVRQMDPGGKTAYRVEEYAMAFVKEPVYVMAVKKKTQKKVKYA